MNMQTPIKVRVTLKNSQYTGELNKWICTIHGEKREVTMQDVQWYCMNVQTAVNSFKEEEIRSFTITGDFPETNTQCRGFHFNQYDK